MIKENELFVIESGQKRRAIKRVCEECKKDFLQADHHVRPYKFCSPKCSSLARRDRIIRQCQNCQKEFEVVKSKASFPSKSGFYFCSRKCKDEAQSLMGRCPEIRPIHFGTGTGQGSCANHAYKIAEQNGDIHCSGCQEDKEYLMIVHHKDGNRDNNPLDGSNWEIICWNCHVKRHLKKIDGKWIYNSKALTPREELVNV